MNITSLKQIWQSGQPYLVIGRIAVLVVGSLVVLHADRTAKNVWSGLKPSTSRAFSQVTQQTQP